MPIFIGAPVALSAGRLYNPISSSYAVYGVSAGPYRAAGSTSEYVNVYDDLENTIFMAQIGDASGLVIGDTVIGDYLDITTTVTGSTVTGISSMTLKGNASTWDNVLVLGLVETPDNNWWGGKYTDLYVKFNVIQHRAASSNIAD